MMILPLASTIQNSLQDLTSRICGIDTNAQATQAFMLGGAAGGAIGYGISAIKEQFKTPGGDSNSPNTTASNMQGQGNNGQQQSFVSRVKNFVNPQMNLYIGDILLRTFFLYLKVLILEEVILENGIHGI